MANTPSTPPKAPVKTEAEEPKNPAETPRKTPDAGAARVEASESAQEPEATKAPVFPPELDPNQSSNVARPSDRVQSIKDGRPEDAVKK